MSLVHDLFPPLLVSIAQGDTGHHEVASMKKQRCIPFGLSLTIVLVLLADLKGQGFFLLFIFIFLGTSQLLLKNQYVQLSTCSELNLMSFDVVRPSLGNYWCSWHIYCLCVLCTCSLRN